MNYLDGADQDSLSYRRARTNAQQEHRRTMIVAATREMLKEMPYEAISLNGIAKRVNLATSNIVRYFESREAILLEIFLQESVYWINDITHHRVNPELGLSKRINEIARVVVRTTEKYPLFGDLLHIHALLLERVAHNEASIKFRRGAFKQLRYLTEWFTASVPEVDDKNETKMHDLMIASSVLLGALWRRLRSSESDRFIVSTQAALVTLYKGAILKE